MKNYCEQITKIKRLLSEVPTVVIGAGAGLSSSAGFDYSGERFNENLGDFEKKYDFHDMYSGGFYQYSRLKNFGRTGRGTQTLRYRL